jgi:hypothetical protein
MLIGRTINHVTVGTAVRRAKDDRISLFIRLKYFKKMTKGKRCD